ncbi:MAG: cyclohexa-1,5-dienecarbonyl-CoA hydratase [Burkholderiales bacterium]|nr:cyclohexa-1,5-dienecarbonyl-CoA hydratase [Burkholderiales bacterium]
MSESPLKVWLDRDGALLRLRLARPKANIIDAAMIAAIAAAIAERREPGPIRAALVDAEGPHFSFGASVEEHLPGQCADMLRGLHALLITMLEWPRPILVAVRGQCLGGGVELALAGSLIFAAPEAQFGQPEIKLGVFAPAASSLLPFRVNQSTAEDLLLSGRSVSGAEAKALGLVSFTADDPEAAALAYFDAQLAGKSAAALGVAVRAARAGMLGEARRRFAAVEQMYLEQTMATHDAIEGLRAFLAKRVPEWRHG